MRRRQHHRRIGGEDVSDSHLLRHRSRRHLQRGGCDDRVAPLRCGSQRLELCRYTRLHHLTPLLGRQRGLRLCAHRTGRSEPAHLRTDGYHRDAEALNPLANRTAATAPTASVTAQPTPGRGSGGGRKCSGADNGATGGAPGSAAESISASDAVTAMGEMVGASPGAILARRDPRAARPAGAPLP